jgi:hypothetical protein
MENLIFALPETARPRVVQLIQLSSELVKMNDKQTIMDEVEQKVVQMYWSLYEQNTKDMNVESPGETTNILMSRTLSKYSVNEKVTKAHILKKALQMSRFVPQNKPQRVEGNNQHETHSETLFTRRDSRNASDETNN